jgi:hypothetical protein
MLDGLAPLNMVKRKAPFQFDHEDARSAPEDTGRNARYKTVLPYWYWVM